MYNSVSTLSLSPDEGRDAIKRLTVSLQYPAMTRPTTESIIASIPLTATTRRPLRVGHFHEDAAYANRRPDGSGDHLLIYTRAGRGLVGDAANLHPATPGGVHLYLPNTAQAYLTDPDAGAWQLYWAHFQPHAHWLDWLDWPALAPGLRGFNPTDRSTSLCADWLVADFEALLGHFAAAGFERDGWGMNALERVLLRCHDANPDRATARLDERVRDAAHWIDRHLHEPMPLSRLARAVHLSESRLSHLFREQMGQTPQRFIEARRMTRAEHLLAHTAMPIADVAAAVGYDNPFYFSTRFSARFNQSPTAYRQRRAHRA